ncbi:hypothetical protein niasHT_024297 [Heterodera trifolii]|uniref:Uncharacterized protein n=1 Tax=Heterodera trifolii TaxID=157864 RepID=A0ABD2JM57_9BILA
MALVNGLFVVQGEANAVLALLRKFRRAQTRQRLTLLDENNPLLRNFADLRDVLNKVAELSEVQFDTFLSPFLEVIKSETTDGLVTARALAAIEKFITYGLLTSNNIRIAGAVQSIADSVTKAKFVGTTKLGIDECVLFQILQSLRSLVLSPGGRHLTNETLCEILQCCFRIGLESSLPELLRMAAENALAEMCRYLFASIQTFEQDIRPGLKELMKFLIALCNPHDDTNKSSMILMGLHLLTVAFETGDDFLRTTASLHALLKDELSHTLLQLLSTQKLPIFAAANRVCFLLLQTLRPQLKFQMESYFLKLGQLISTEQLAESVSISSAGSPLAAKAAVCYELRELALEALVDMWRLPGLVAELYLNYDCSLYCSNLFEDLIRTLLHNAFPNGPLLFSTHILSLDTVLAVVELIETNCAAKQLKGFTGKGQIGIEEELMHTQLVDHPTPIATAHTIEQLTEEPHFPLLAEMIDVKKQKRLMTEGTELFNRHSPQKGVEFLCEKGLLKNPLEPQCGRFQAQSFWYKPWKRL